MNRYFNIIPGEDTCCVLLYGDIGDTYGSVSSGEIVRELLAAEGSYEHIDVRINSNGGEVYTGIAIFNALRSSKADIHIYIDGIAASMAGVIALCGKPVEMSKYSRLMLHSVSGSCYGDKRDLRNVLSEIESLEDTLCSMLAEKIGCAAEEVKARYFDGVDHWLTADEALSLGLIDGIYDADPVPEGSTPEQIYTIFNNRLREPQNETEMNINELKTRAQFKDCATEADVLARIDALEARAQRADELEATAEAAAEEERQTLLDAAEGDGRITAEMRGVYENLLKEHPEDGKKALNALQPKKRIVDALGSGQKESPWEKRQREIKEKLNR